MAARQFSAGDPELNVLYKELSDRHLQPLWELKGLLTPEPAVRSRPYQWRGQELKELGRRSGDLVPIERGGDRRVLACANPGLDGAPYAVSTLWAAVQYLGGGELAPAHRHTPAALRFVMEGEGVWTLVDGDPIHMARGDLVLTPSWTFHEHHNSGTTPMMWMDVLDLPVVAALDAVFYENGPSDQVANATDPASRSEQWFGGGAGLLPAPDTDALPAGPHSPLLAYRWMETERALRAQLAVSGASSAKLRYSDPARGGDVMPTMRCEIERVLTGARTPAVRQTGGRVACVLNGRGRARIADEVFDVEPGDLLAIPSWSWWSVEAEEELDVFSVSDAPILQALGLFRSARGA
jgi:gentisate 1,2-dioxygenase